jgi:hypothetical protein
MPAPSAENAPRLHGGRKGAYRVAPRWRKRHPCPHRSDEQCGQDEGDRGSAAPSARLPSHRTGTKRRSRVPSVSQLFAPVTGRFALGRMAPAQGPPRPGASDKALTRSNGTPAGQVSVLVRRRRGWSGAVCGTDTERQAAPRMPTVDLPSDVEGRRVHQRQPQAAPSLAAPLQASPRRPPAPHRAACPRDRLRGTRTDARLPRRAHFTDEVPAADLDKVTDAVRARLAPREPFTLIFQPAVIRGEAIVLQPVPTAPVHILLGRHPPGNRRRARSRRRPRPRTATWLHPPRQPRLQRHRRCGRSAQLNPDEFNLPHSECQAKLRAFCENNGFSIIDAIAAEEQARARLPMPAADADIAR